MNSGLKKYFPMIRERQEVLKRIQKNKKLEALFESWNEEQQEEFLNIVTGIKGVKILYDSFFKEIMNPEYDPERLEAFLTFLRILSIRYCLKVWRMRLMSEDVLI